MSHTILHPKKQGKAWQHLAFALILLLVTTHVCHTQSILCSDGTFPRPWFLDRDRDGFYAETTGSTLLCAAPGSQWVDQTSGADCNDYKVSYEDLDKDGHGSAVKIPCGNIYTSDDCDDDNKKVHALQTFYADKDGDSYGDPSNPDPPVCAPEPPSGSVANISDCNDKNADARTNGQKYYGRDADKDGLGSSIDKVDACTVDKIPAGYVANTDDCNDKNFDARKRGVRFYYMDEDKDKVGDENNKKDVCDEDSRPAEYVDNKGDCNDKNGETHTKMKVFYYADFDGDTKGSADVKDREDACNFNAIPALRVRNNTDCNDDNRNVQVRNTKFYYADLDGDGYGNPVAKLDWCDVRNGQPDCTVIDKTDEDDNALTFLDDDGDGWGSTTKTNKKARRQKPFVADNDGDTNDKDRNSKPAGVPMKKAFVPCKLPQPPYRTQMTNNFGLSEMLPLEGFFLTASPNPVGRTAVFQYRLLQAATVRISIFDVLGREIGVVFNGHQTAGLHSTTHQTGKLVQGTYYCRMTATINGKLFNQSIVLVKAH